MEQIMAQIEDIINNVVKQDFSKAGPTFAEIMNQKVDDALEQEKISVASQVFNQVTDGENDEEIISDPEADTVDNLDDEEVQDALADEIESDAQQAAAEDEDQEEEEIDISDEEATTAMRIADEES